MAVSWREARGNTFRSDFPAGPLSSSRCRLRGFVRPILPSSLFRNGTASFTQACFRRHLGRRFPSFQRFTAIDRLYV
jgi:hypothetical protein